MFLLMFSVSSIDLEDVPHHRLLNQAVDPFSF